MLMTAWAWVRDGGSDDEGAIRNVLAGNLCRCTGYQHIVASVARAVRAKRKARGKRRPGDAARGKRRPGTRA
jgi:carbon-monoxide dehydrogenase small subunit